MRNAAVAFMVVVVASLLFILGVASASQGLLLVWFCLNPIAWFVFGRASLSMTKGRRIALVSDNEYRALAARKASR